VINIDSEIIKQIIKPKNYGRLDAKSIGIYGNLLNVVELLGARANKELGVKEQCKESFDVIAKYSQELIKYFDFINYQESYHIELMRDTLASYGVSR